MRERLVTLALALGALALFAAMFLRSAPGPGLAGEVPRPMTTEHRGNGYFAALSWLAADGVPAISLRERFNALTRRTDLAKSGNLLVVTLPAATEFKTEEFLPLDAWVRAGNTLLVLAALADDPDWALNRAGLVISDLNLLTGLEFETARSHEERKRAGSYPAAGGTREPEARSGPRRGGALQQGLRMFSEPERSELIANRSHAYFEHVRAAVALSDYSRQSWALRVPYEGFALELAHVGEDGSGVLWTRPLGAGRIIVSGFGSLFTNRALGLADNAALLANLIAVNVARGGTVIFDDAHQGLSEVYDPSKFYQDRRLYLTVGVLIAAWLVWVLGSTRLRMPAARIAAPREIDLVRSTGGFLARVLRTPVAARRLLESFLARTPGRAGWAYLERHPRIASADLEQLKTWYAAAYGEQRVPLRRLHNLIARIERQLQ
jgi:hypothetical protein